MTTKRPYAEVTTGERLPRQRIADVFVDDSITVVTQAPVTDGRTDGRTTADKTDERTKSDAKLWTKFRWTVDHFVRERRRRTGPEEETWLSLTKNAGHPVCTRES